MIAVLDITINVMSALRSNLKCSQETESQQTALENSNGKRKHRGNTESICHPHIHHRQVQCERDHVPVKNSILLCSISGIVYFIHQTPRYCSGPFQLLRSRCSPFNRFYWKWDDDYKCQGSCYSVIVYWW